MPVLPPLCSPAGIFETISHLSVVPDLKSTSPVHIYFYLQNRALWEELKVYFSNQKSRRVIVVILIFIRWSSLRFQNSSKKKVEISYRRQSIALWLMLDQTHSHFHICYNISAVELPLVFCVVRRDLEKVECQRKKRF